MRSLYVLAFNQPASFCWLVHFLCANLSVIPEVINQDLSRQLLRPPCPRRGWHPTKLELKPGNFCWIWWTTKRTQPASQTWRCIAEVDTWGSVQNMNPLFFIWSCVDAFGLKNWCWTFLLHFSKPNASWGGSSTTGSRSCATSTTEGRRKKSRPARHEDIIKSQTSLINIDIIDTLVGQNPRTSWYCRYLILYSLWLYALLAPSMQNPYFFGGRSQWPWSGYGSPAAGRWIPSCVKKHYLYATPLKINMEHNHGSLEDHFPFSMGDL